MNRVKYDNLSYEDSRVYTYEGKLFSGVAYEGFADGAIASEVNIIQGKEHGLTKAFYPSGTVKYQATYVRGVRHGVESTWYRDGVLKEENTLHKGYLMKSKKWSDSGELLEEYIRPEDDPISKVVAKIDS